MANLLQLARLAGAVYDTPPSAVPGWTATGSRLASAGGIWEGLQAAFYAGPGGGVIAFCGTNLSSAAIYGSLQDIDADLTLGTGQNSSYFSAAETFCAPYAGRGDVVVCGHSLGGAIAQVVANRMGFRMATFNAPGVGSFASRNWGTGTVGMTAIRMAGTIGGSVRHPVQAYRDMRYAFRAVRGVNVRIEGDAVSAMGVHYGLLKTVKSAVKGSALTQHGIATVLASLEADPIGRQDISSF